MANQRIVRKSKAGVQDLILGKGQVTQQRGANEYQIDRLDIPLAVDSIAEMTALDTEDFTRARVYSDATTFVDYIFDPTATEGEAPDDTLVEGFWIAKQVVDAKRSVLDLVGFVGASDRQQLSLLGYQPDSVVGGGRFYWDATKAKSEHDGGTIISPTVPWGNSIPNYIIAAGETDPAGLGCFVRDYELPVNAHWFGASTSVLNNGVILKLVYDRFRDVTIQSNVDEILTSEEPIKIRSSSYYRGNGQKITRQGDNIVEYASLTKTNNSVVVITNPERPTQIVDCLLWCNGEREDSNYMQKFVIEQASFRSSAPHVDSVGLYTIQGGNWTMKNVDWIDFGYAVNGYEVFSCVMEKVVTNGKVRFREGTTIAINQCAAGGSGNSGLTGGGFEFDQIRYSSIRASSSDGTPNTAYRLKNCFQFHIDACGSEFAAAELDTEGNCITFEDGNQCIVTNFYGVCNEDPLKAAFSFGTSNKIVFHGGKIVNIDSEGDPLAPNYDFYISGNNCYIETNQMQFGNNSYGEPKIRFEVGVSSSVVIVHPSNVPGADLRPKIYYSDGTGATLVRFGVIDVVTNSNGVAVKFDDGTLICTHTLPKDDFLIASSAFTTAQGINWYRSNVATWDYPVPFTNVNAKVTITPRMGSGGTRLAIPRYTDTGETNAVSGQIQLIGVEDWIAAGQAYLDLIDVQVTAIGRFK